MWDGIGTLAIGLLLIVIAVVLAIEMKGLLIGESATTADQQKIAAAIEVEPSVQRLIHMRTEHIGPDELLVGAKIELVDDLSVTGGGRGGQPDRDQRAPHRADRPRDVPRARHLPHPACPAPRTSRPTSEASRPSRSPS